MREKLILSISLLLRLANSALTLGLILHLNGISLYASQFRINHDTSAIFAHDNLLVHLDVELTLWRNLVKAATASIVIHIHNAQTVAGALRIRWLWIQTAGTAL